MNHDDLHDLLARATDAIESPGLSRGAVAIALKRRNRRRGAMAVATATAAVVAVLVAVTVAGDGMPVPAPAGSPTASTSPATSPTTTVTPDCAELTGPRPPVSATPVPRVPAPEAEHTTFNELGTVAAWFNESRVLPELVVFDLTRQQELAREDLGVGEVAAQPSLRILGESLYFRTAADPNVWMRYAWNEDGYPQVYKTCN